MKLDREKHTAERKLLAAIFGELPPEYDVPPSNYPPRPPSGGANELRAQVEAMLQTSLSPKERRVLELRYGLKDGKPKSPEETAVIIGQSEKEVELLETDAFNKLRTPDDIQTLKHHLGVE